jgi:hypothetical protein
LNNGLKIQRELKILKMEKLQMKNTWFYKLKFLSLVLCLTFFQYAISQQNTFSRVYKNYGSTDIQEDDKNGYLLTMNNANSIFRINSDGDVLWSKEISNVMSILRTENHSSKSYLFGSEDVSVIDNRGNYLLNKFKSQFKDSSQCLYDVVYNQERKEFVVAGGRWEIGCGTPVHFWIACVDLFGKLKWEKTWYDKDQSRFFQRIFPIKNTGGYLMLGTDWDNSEYWDITTIDSLGNIKTRHYVDGHWNYGRWDYSVTVYDIAPYKDSLFLLSIYQPAPKSEFSYFVVNQQGVRVKQIRNKPLCRHHLPLKNGNILLYEGDFLAMLDSNFNFIWKREKIFGNYPNHDITIVKMKQSKDGGFYGIANGTSILPDGDYDSDLVFAFKTDTLGLIYENKPAKTEWDAPMMLQPNPAKNKVRITIPYYHGTIEALFYNLQGQFVESQTLLESELFDISRLSPGIYFVKGRNIETNETRTMKLVVK